MIIEDLLDDSGSDDNKSIPTMDEIPEEIFVNRKETDLFNCIKCDFTFTAPLDLNSHVEVSHKKKECPNNDVPVTVNVEEPSKVQNLRSTSESGCVVCPFCKLQSKSLETLKTHIENIHTKDKKLNDQDKILNKGQM